MEFNTVKDKQKKMEDGAWFQLNCDPDGKARVLCSTLKNPDFRKSHQANEHAFRKRHRIAPNRELSDEQWTKILSESAYGTIVKDWEGIFLDGEELEFSKTNFRKVFTELWAVKEEVLAIAGLDEFDGVAVEEVVEKNSDAPSDGS